MSRAAALWTGGKDCALALQLARETGHRVERLVTFAPPSPVFLAHPLPFLREQARAMGLPHQVVTLSPPLDAAYAGALRALRHEGFASIVTGDIAEVDGQPHWITARNREAGLEVVTPLWRRERAGVLEELLERGFRAVFSLVKPPFFTREWAGRRLDRAAAAELAELGAGGLDVCGENGEYHTLVLDGPGFAASLSIEDSAVRESGGMFHLEILRLASSPKAAA